LRRAKGGIEVQVESGREIRMGIDESNDQEDLCFSIYTNHKELERMFVLKDEKELIGVRISRNKIINNCSEFSLLS